MNAKRVCRSLRSFTKLVDKLPYPGDVIIQSDLNRVFTAESPRPLYDATRHFARVFCVLQVIHISMVASRGTLGYQFAKEAIKTGDLRDIAGAGIQGSIALVAAAVTVSQGILLHRVVSHTKKLLNDPDKIRPMQRRISQKSPLVGTFLTVPFLMLSTQLTPHHSAGTIESAPASQVA